MVAKAPRFPSVFGSQEQKEAFEQTERDVKELQGESFSFKDAQGNFLGPFGVLCYTPSTFKPFLSYSKSYYTLPHLTPKERELTTLATVSVTKSDYVEYAHQKIGISLGLTQDQVERASAGHLPKGLSDREECVYELALSVARGFGNIKDKQFDSAVALLGKEGVAALAQLVGGYLLISTMESVAGGSVPES
ncbi:hypothetical protein EJ05DRAFT_534472 [Pseudovirgaria hyperparasitica]|uniref:Uncharacterized protein n=1 Tax=Pseudovirgaria hyperparasitica TaxID=470096 RepID=A0A6A6WM04_9PEZI|nr:uncharacterized protein EJ05DRAFT_534472 [Pseudovirgaria hyperparasitica]KAF2763049.1 hypothetical protein EJ05DRAFT_534472 [Pseudovirgaria hyperparasitica]